MFLKAYTDLSDRKLIEQLNANIDYQYPQTGFMPPKAKGGTVPQMVLPPTLPAKAGQANEILWIFFGVHTANAVRIAKNMNAKQIDQKAA